MDPQSQQPNSFDPNRSPDPAIPSPQQNAGGSFEIPNANIQPISTGNFSTLGNTPSATPQPVEDANMDALNANIQPPTPGTTVNPSVASTPTPALNTGGSFEIQNAYSHSSSVGGFTPSAPPSDVAPDLAAGSIGRRRRTNFFSLGSAMIVLGIFLVAGAMAGFYFLLKPKTSNTAITPQQAAREYSVTQIPLSELAQTGQLGLDPNQQLAVNGLLNVNNSLVLTPTSQPGNAKAGQMYYDSATNQLSYFNGTSFVKITDSSSATSLVGLVGTVPVGNGLGAVSGALVNTGVTNIIGTTGQINVSSSTGSVQLSLPTLASNSVVGTNASGGLTSINSGTAGLCLVSTAGAPVFGSCTGQATVNSINPSGGGGAISGSITIAGSGGLTVTSNGSNTLTITNTVSGGNVSAGASHTIGALALFDTAGTHIADSVLVQSGAIGSELLTLSGDLSVTGGITGDGAAITNVDAITLQGFAASQFEPTITTLSATKGGTGLSNPADNGVLVGTGGATLEVVTASAAGKCFMSNSTNTGVVFQDCPVGGNISQGSALGETQTIGANARLAKFGAVGNTITDSLIEDDGTTITIFGNLTVDTGTITGNGAAITNVDAITLQGFAASQFEPTITTLSATKGGTGLSNPADNGVLVGTGGATLEVVTASAAGKCFMSNSTNTGVVFQDCPVGGNISQGSALGETQTIGANARLAKFGAVGNTITDSLIEDDGTTITIFGNLTVDTGTITGNGAGITDIDAGNISTGTLLDGRLSSNVALLNRTDQVFTDRNIFRTNSASDRAFSIQDASSNDLFIADTSGDRVFINQAPTSITDVTLQVAGAISVITTAIPVQDVAHNGTLFFDTNTGLFTIIQDGVYKTLCNTVDQGCGAGAATITLQAAYAGGEQIITANNKDIDIELASGTNSSLTVDIQGTSTGRFAIQDDGSDIFSVNTAGSILNVPLTVTSANAITLGSAGPLGTDGAIVFKSAAGTDTTTLKSGSPSGSFTLTLPDTDGGANECLKSDGSGVLSWTTCLTGSSGSGVNSISDGAGILQKTGNVLLYSSDSTVSVIADPTLQKIDFKVAGAGTCSTCASTSLNNLASVAINESLISDTNNTDDLGSSAIAWRNGYFGTSLQSPLLQTADTNTASTNSNSIVIRSGNAAGATSNSGNVIIDSGTATGTVGNVIIGSVAPNILFAGGAGSTGCTITTLGVLTCDGTINGATISGGTVSGGTLSGGTVSGGTLTGSAVNSLNVSGTAISGTGALSVDANGANNISIGGISTGSINFAGGAGSTGCTITTLGVLTCDGTINGATISGGTVSGGTLSGGTVSGGTLTGSAVNSLNVSGTAISGTGALSVDANGANNISIGGISTGSINFAGGAGSTGCTITTLGNISCDGKAGFGQAIVATGAQLQVAGGAQLLSTTSGNNANLAGTIVYDTGDGKYKIYEGGSGTLKTLCNVSDGCTVSGGGLNLQNAYNGSPGGTTPEIKLASTQGAIDIQDADSTIGGNLINIRASNAGGLGSILFGVSNTGATLFQNSANSSTAMQIQNASSATLFNVDTSTTSNLITNGDFEGAGTTGWTTKGAGSTTFSQVSTHQWQGNNSLQIVTPTATQEGVKYNYNFATSTQYTISLYAKVASGSISDIAIGGNHNGSDTSCLGSQTLTTSWTRFSCSFSTSGSIGATPHVFIKKTGSSAETFLVDGVQLQTGATATAFDPGGRIQLSGLVNSPLTLQNKNDSTSAFQILNQAGSTLFNADTVNSGLSVSSSATTSTALSVAANTLTTGSALSVSSSAARPSGNLASVTSAVSSSGITDASSLFNVSRGVTQSGGSSPAYVSVSSISCTSCTSTPNLSHAISASPNRLMVAYVFVRSSSATPPTISATNVTSMQPASNTNNVRSLGNDGAYLYAAAFYKVAPANNTNTVTATTTGCVSCEMAMVTQEWSNVSQTVPVGTVNSASYMQSPSTIFATGSSNDGMSDAGMMASFNLGATSPTGTGQLKVLDVATTIAFGNYNLLSSYKNNASTPTQTFGYFYNFCCGASNGVQIGMAIKPIGYDITGNLVSLSSSCSGTCSDTSNILNLNQQTSSATGSVLKIQNSGTGADIELASGIIRSTNDIVRIQSSAGTGNNALYVDAANKKIAINLSGAPTYTVDAGGDINTSSAFRVAGTLLQSSHLTDGAQIVKLAGTATGGATTTLNQTNNTTDGIVLQANSITTANALLVNANALTTGAGFKVATTSNTFTSGSLAVISQTSSYTGAASLASNVLNVSRTSTTNTAVSVALDSLSSGKNTSTWNTHTVGSGSNRMMIIGITSMSAAATAVSWTATAQSAQPANLLGSSSFSSSFNSGSTHYITYWWIPAPNSGGGTISVTCGSCSFGWSGEASTWNNVDQTGPTNLQTQSSSVNGTTLSLTYSNSLTGMVVDHVGYIRTVAAAAGQTQWGNQSAQSASYGSYKSPILLNANMQHADGGCCTSTGNGVIGAVLNAVAAPAVTFTGALASLSSNCINTTTCTDSSNVLNLNQQYTGASGAVLNVQNSGTSNVGILSSSTTAATAIQGSSNSTGTAILASGSGAGTALVANNTSTGKSIDVQSNSTSVFTISNTASNEGAALFMNRTNNSSAFKIQAASSGATVFNADTTGATTVSVGSSAGTLGSWSALTSIQTSGPTSHPRQKHTSVIHNGYAYVIGGQSGTAATTAISTVHYARLKADGTIPALGAQGGWTAATSLPGARALHASTVANGYLYVIGGQDATPTAQSTVYYSKINTDGSLGSWTTATNNLTTGAGGGTRTGAKAVFANGRIYVVAGKVAGTTSGSTVFASVNADGSLGTWTAGGSLASGHVRDQMAVEATEGYIYAFGGYDGSDAPQSNTYMSKINTTTGQVTWSTTTALCNGTARGGNSSAVLNGYIYSFGGSSTTSASPTPTNTLCYAPISAVDGSLSAWTTSLTMGAVTNSQTTNVFNGYVYDIGGFTTGSVTRNTINYSSAPRVRVSGSLDLIGTAGSGVPEGGSGGTLTAGDTRIVGTFNVSEQANFMQNVTINGNLNTGGQVLHKNSSDSATAFQVQNSSGVTLLGVDTSTGAIISGVADGGSAIAFKLNVTNTFATSGAKLLSVQNNGTERFAIDYRGHIVTASPAPTSPTVDTNAGTGGSPSCTVQAGNETSGTIRIVTGSATFNAGTWCTATISFSTTPRPVISGANQVAGALKPYISASTTTLTIGISDASSAAGGTTYDFNYFMPQ